jgi:chaperone BCS1
MNEIFLNLNPQILLPGILLMFSGAIIALARNIPLRAWTFLKSKLVLSVTINDDDPMFKALTDWIEKSGHGNKSRTLVAKIINEYGDKRVQVSPYKSSFFVKFNGRHYQFTRFSKELKAGKEMNVIETEGYRISAIGFNREHIKEMLNFIYQEYSRSCSGVMVYNSFHGSWSSCRKINKRQISTVSLPGTTINDVLQDIKKFLKSEDEYNKKGIGWHRGYLFHGIPGSGKTSLAIAIASELRLPIFNLWLSSCHGDNYLMDLFSKVPPRSIILMEDIDCVMPKRGDAINRNVSLTAVLNVLDGICSSHGCVVIMTTNHKENLDPAVLRNGRVDVDIEFLPSTEEQILDYARNGNIKIDMDTIKSLSGLPMASVQEALLNNMV